MKHPLRHMSLQRQFGLLAMVGVGLLSLAFGALGLWTLNQSTQRTLDERLATTRLVARYLDDALERHLAELATAAADPELGAADGDPQRSQQVLMGLLTHEPGLNTHYTFLLDAEGIVLQTEPYRADVVGANFAGYPAVAQALASGQSGVSNALNLDPDGPPVVVLLVPLRNANGRLTGILGEAVDLVDTDTLDYLRAVAAGQTGHADIVDGNGFMLASTNAHDTGKPNGHPDLYVPLLGAGRADVGVTSYLEDGVMGEKHVTAFVPLTAAPWGVGLGQSEAETFAPLWTMRNWLIGLGLSASLIALILTRLRTRRLVQPLVTLTAAVQRMAAGDLTSPISVAGAGEVGCLAQSFEAMRAAVEARARELATLNEIGQALSSLTEPAVLFHKIHELTGRVMDNRNLYIALFDEPNQQISFPLYYVDGKPCESAARPFGVGLTEYVIRSGAPLWLPRNVEAAFTELGIERIGAPCRCLLAVPMIASEQVVGIITVQDYETEDVYDEGRLELLSTIASQAAVAVENVRLFEAEQAQLRLAHTLQQVGALLTARLSLDELFEALFDLLAQVIQYDVVSIQLLTEDGSLDLVASRGFPDLLQAKKLARHIGAQTVEQRWAGLRVMVIPDTRTDPRWIYAPENDYVRSWVGAPLLVKGQLIGVLNVDSKIANAYDETSGETIMAFANQAAIAIENARLFEAEARRARQLALVGEIARQAAATLIPERLLREATEALVRAFGYHDVVLFLVNAEAGEVVRETWAGSFERDISGPARQPIGKPGIIGWVARHGETLLANDVAREPRYRPFLPATRAELCVPIKDGERVVGGINIESKRLHAFDAVDVATIEALADELAVALRNARLFAETRQRAEELAALFEFSAALQAVAGPDDIPLLALDHALSLIGGDGGMALLFDAERRQLTPAAARNVAGSAEIRLQPQDFPAGHRPLSGRACAVAHTASAHETCPLIRALPHVAAGWCAPLRTASGVIGLLHIHTRHPRPVRDSDLRLLETVSNQAAIALEKARLAESLRQHTVRLEEEVAARTAEIHAEKERSDTILTNVGDAIAITDAGGQALYVNPAFERLTGYAAAEIVGQNLRALLDNEIPNPVYAKMQATLDAGQVWRGEITNWRKDGRRYDAGLAVAPVLGPNGAAVNYVSSHRDITRLKELDRMKDEFVSNVSHELRTPITNICLYLELLGQAGAERLDRYLPILESESWRLSRLIEDLLTLSRIDAAQGRAPLVREPHVLDSLIAEALDAHAARAEVNELTLTHEPNPAVPAVPIDYAQMMQVFTNLVGNAVAYTPAGGSVTVTAEVCTKADGTYAIVSVQDTGLGIAADDLPHIFERFYRGESARQTRAPGTGLGLAICQEILDWHGGRVEVESDPGQGTTFNVWLPLPISHS